MGRRENGNSDVSFGYIEQKVLKIKGLTVLVELFLSDHLEALLHRTCRCLANMLQSPGSWKLAESSALTEKLIKLLQKTEKDEYRPTYIRTIRLLGKTRPNVQRLLDKNAVSVIGKLIDSKNPEVNQSAIRCLHSLATQGCSEQFAGQFVSSGKLDVLLTLAKTQNYEAFYLVIMLCNYQNFRPEFGNSEGITTFTNMFNEEVTSHSKKPDILSILCLCSKEAVNRVKLRENNSLPLLLTALDDQNLSAVHERVISSLLCYIYDDAGFEVLLTNGLVKVLVKYLKKHCNLMSHFEHSSWASDGTIQTGLEEDSEGKTAASSDGTIQTGLVEDCNALTAPSGQQGGAHGSSSPGTKPKIIETTTEGNQLEETTVKEYDQSSFSKPYFHIDSPTYKNYSSANDDDEVSENKCIQYLSPPHASEYVTKTSYSPISNVSYYSPGESSPEYSTSLTSSPESSHGTGLRRNSSGIVSCNSYMLLSGSQVPEHVHPKYPKQTGVSCTLYKNEAGFTTDRLRRSKRIESDIDSDGADVSDNCVSSEDGGEIIGDFSPVFSPSFATEEEENADDSVAHGTSIISSSVTELDAETQLQDVKFDYIKDTLEGDLKNVLKRKPAKKLKKITHKSHAVENHILSLLSRVSQMNDPAGYLVTMETMSCLLDYLSQMERPLARCARLLSRVFRNPLCFHDLMALGVPLLVYEKLMSQENISNLFKNLRKPRHRDRSSFSSTCLDDDTDSDRFSIMSNMSSPDEEQPHKRYKSSIDDRSSSGKHKAASCMKAQEVCSAGVSGLALLEDLAGTAQSQYGKGVVDRLLCTKPSKESQLHVGINILYITWMLDSRQHFFDHLAMLDSLVGALKPGGPMETHRKHSIVYGLQFQLTLLKSGKHYGKATTFSDYLSGVLDKEEAAVVEKACNRDISVTDDDCVTFVVNGCDIHASRKTLVSKSEIFVAMLEGHYSEALVSNIPLAETSSYAFSCVLCYLHDCDFNKCPTLCKMKTKTVTKASAEEIIEVYNEAEKYMLPELKAQSYSLLAQRYVVPEAAMALLEFGVLHQKHDIIKATVFAIFSECDSRELMVHHVDEFLHSKYADLISNTIFEILTE
ncbi:uncharacterized protein LOC127854293 isoform X3 [Dreissena polymorpha]|uniref:uncharacterized protein LOC127854293 isoform X3 n=1 Tax=Dreissena polymorpha TaxID=45954 RepID=UPI0022643587|nr:uncharacterized protein LOC127854293 isoform X3 [Dreissena polymorpha]